MRALILGGTGMLAGVAEALTAEGWWVVLPSRRYSPIAAESASGAAGKAIWVEAQWDRPGALADGAAAALRGGADLLVAWVHSSYRERVISAVDRCLTRTAPVVEVCGSTVLDTKLGLPEPVLAGRETQQVVLGYVEQAGRRRWLTHSEIADGVLAAVRRAVRGLPSSVHQVGTAANLARR